MSSAPSPLGQGHAPDALLTSAMAFLLLIPPVFGGLYSREQYLPFFCVVALLFAAVGLRATRQGDRLARDPIDTLFAALAGLYCFTLLWAKSEFAAVDGAMKYAVYLMSFLMARRSAACRSNACAHDGLRAHDGGPAREGWLAVDGNRLIQRMIIAGGLLAVSVSYLAGAGVIDYPTAIRGGSFQGTLGYENSLGAFAMFALFFLFPAWLEARADDDRGLFGSMAYGATGYLLLAAIILSSSRAIWVISALFLVAQLAVLPRGIRAGLLSRMMVILAAVTLTVSMLDSALRKPDAGLFLDALSIGLFLSIGFEAVRVWASRLLAEGSGPGPALAPSLSGAPLAYRSAGLLLAGVTTCVRMATMPRSAASAASGAAAAIAMVPKAVVAGLKSISISDKSLLMRVLMSRDAWRIAADNPFGAGGGAWNVLYPRYQVVPYSLPETHNHFAQVLVETGFPGLLAYAAIWGLLAFAVARAYMKLRRRSPRVVCWSAAIFALGAHSAVDYDLSFPAIFVAMLAGMALLLSELGPLPVFRREGGPHKDDAGTAAPGTRPAPTRAAVALISAVVLAVAGRSCLGTIMGRAGDRALAAASVAPVSSQKQPAEKVSPVSDVSTGRRLLQAAMSLDNLNPDYALGIAESYAEDYAGSGSAEDREATLLYLGLSRAKDPFDPQRVAAAVRTLLKAGLIDESIDAAACLLEMAPASRSDYTLAVDCVREGIARNVPPGMGLAELARNDAAQDGLPEASREALARYATYAIAWTNALRSKQEQITGLDAYVYGRNSLALAPKMALVAGQAMLLKGNAAGAREYLTLAAKDKTLSAEANALLRQVP